MFNVKPWDIIKLIVGIAFVALVMRFIFNEKYFGPLPFEYVLIMLALILLFIVYFVLRYFPLIKSVIKPKSHYDNIENIIIGAVAGGDIIHGEIDDKDSLSTGFKWDISLSIGPQGENHYLRFDGGPKTGTRNIFYDGRRGVIRGEIRGDSLGGRPKDAVEAAVLINTILERGEIMPISVTPMVVRQIEEILKKEG